MTSHALAVRDGQQVGYAYGPNVPSRASLWYGTASSWVDLNPSGQYSSAARGTDGVQQVGDTYVGNVGNVRHASLWTGTAESWVDLHPVGAHFSLAFGVDRGQQVGYVNFAGYAQPKTSRSHAALWHGSAAGWVDLNPPGATESIAHAVFEGMQMGNAYFATEDTGAITDEWHAVLWNGTAASAIDLHEVLPRGLYYRSGATGIWSDSTNTYISGFAVNRNNQWQAVVWRHRQ
jgi:hypothetical protein